MYNVEFLCLGKAGNLVYIRKPLPKENRGDAIRNYKANLEFQGQYVVSIRVANGHSVSM